MPGAEGAVRFKRVLIANRGEVAVRLARALSELGIGSVAVYSPEDAQSLHVVRADRAAALGGRGAAAYLDIAALIDVARSADCDAVHPGYGFLSESAEFARRCEAAGLTFIGPSPDALALFGDKAAARALARAQDVPLARGTAGGTAIAQARAFLAELGPAGAIMIKAVAGGGGRGMRVVDDEAALEDAFDRAGSEARAAFGVGDLYVEELIRGARHVEVQILGDRTGAITHLFERDCSLQRRHQKLVEIAPAPDLDSRLRDAMIAASVRLARAGRIHTLCTFEFLVDTASGAFTFMEANPRLQVEHTVTEAVMGVDLVRAQIALAEGRTLADLGLAQAMIAPPRGVAIELRVNMERIGADGSAVPTGGTLAAFDPPAGAGIRIDGFGYAGYETNTSFDPLLAKLIAHVPDGGLADALAKAYRASCEFRIEGVETNLGVLQNLLLRPELLDGRFDTRFVERHAGDLVAGRVAHRRLYPTLSPPGAASADAADQTPTPEGTVPVRAPMGGRVVAITVAAGDRVGATTAVAVIEAMKMQQTVPAGVTGIVRDVAASPGGAVTMGQPLLFIEPLAIQPGADSAVVDAAADDTADGLAELRAAKAALLDATRPEAVAKQQARAAMTARARIDCLCDAGSFHEIGGLIRNLKVARAAPADGVVAGSARIDGRSMLVLSQDFTVFGGSSGRLGGEKMERIARQAMMQGLPLVMLFDGGGHRVQDGQSSRDYAPAMPLFHDLARMSGWVPMVSAILGAGFAANTNYSGMADYVVMVRGQSVMGLAGPALVRAGTGEDITAEALGGAAVQVDQTGLADHGADSEAAALHAIRGFLSYLPSNARQAAPVVADWRAASDGSDLASIVPANSRRAYDMRRVVAGLADADSVFELKPTFARNAITAFARLAGRSVGFIANQPLVRAGMLDSPACEKIAHFIGLCDAFGLPLIYLVDIPGLSIGSAAERSTLGRRSAKLLFELGHATVPRISVILRKGYGLGYLTMAGGRSFDADACFAWPTAEICAMSVEGSVDVAFRRDYEGHENPTARRQQLIDEIRAQISPIKAAEGFGVDDVIEPVETRARILEVLDRAPPRRANAMPPKYRAISPI